MTAIKNEQRLLNSKNAAFYLNIPEQTLRSSRVHGLIYGIKPPPFKKMGSRIFYEIATLDQWINGIPTHNNSTEYEKNN